MSTKESGALDNADWFTSSYSNDQGGDCVQGARLDGSAMAVRDSKNTTGPAFVVSPGAWSGFLSALNQGELDRHDR
jgi:hypothetical protein